MNNTKINNRDIINLREFMEGWFYSIHNNPDVSTTFYIDVAVLVYEPPSRYKHFETLIEHNVIKVKSFKYNEIAFTLNERYFELLLFDVI